jgi:orotate phosphoribosyltransferase
MSWKMREWSTTGSCASQVAAVVASAGFEVDDVVASVDGPLLGDKEAAGASTGRASNSSIQASHLVGRQKDYLDIQEGEYR